MPSTLASELSDKSVMSTDGQRVGKLHNLTVDLETGELDSVIVETDRRELFGIAEREDGRISLPAHVLEDVSDQLIISPPGRD